MDNNKRLLDVRRDKKTKAPRFMRKSGTIKQRLKDVWRKPKGIHNKVRLHKRGNNVMVSTGYGSPVAVRGLTRSGYEPIVVCNASQLHSLNPESQTAVISSSVGQKKRMDIVKKALELKIKIHNLKDAHKYLKLAESDMSQRKERKQLSKKERDEKVKEAKKLAQEKELEEKKKLNEERSLTPEEAIKKEEEDKLKEKQEQDKVLIHKA